MTEILPFITVNQLSPKIQASGELIGPFLEAGLSYGEIAAHLSRSEDWVATRVRELRSALAENALENGGDELSAELRERLEAFASARTSARRS